MKIKTKMFLSTAVSIALVIIVGLLIMLLMKRVNVKMKTEKYIDRVVEEVFELNIITNEYVSSRSKSSEYQWQAKHDAISEVIESRKYMGQDEAETLERLVRNHLSAKAIFMQLKRASDNKNLDVRLLDQLAFKSQAIVSNAFEFKRIVRAQMDANQRKSGVLLVVIVVLLVQILIMNYVLANNLIVKPIRSLQKGVQVIGGGNLEHKVGKAGEDEICELSRSFDQMIINLKKVTASRDELDKEMNERKQAEESMASFAHILEESLNEIYIFDAKTLRFIQVNKGARLNLGYTLEEHSCLTPLDLKPEFTSELFMRMIEPLRVDENKKIEFTTVHRRKDGSLYDVEVHLQLSTFQSVPVFVAIILDITERKKMEVALIQSEKLKSIGTITAGISHEFNNILAVISGKIQLLEMDYKDNKELTDELETIMKATEDGAKISNSMLKFTQTEKDITDFENYDICDLIKQSIDFTMPRWKNEAQIKGINYKMDTDGMKRVPSILCNPTELREVFINIMNNALDAMPEGGSLSLSTWSGDNTISVSISDTGKGMTEEVRKKIFDPFFTTRRPEGTGLGMSTTYGIVARHGGKIEVESELGKGSTFALQFPATIKVVNPIVTPEPDQETIDKNLHILVVDDEEAICNILDKFLSSSGHMVRTVNNGSDAIELIKSEHFDLVLCDLAMPNVFGYDVIKVLNTLEKRPKIGIITGWGEELKPIDKEGMKVDYIIRKPFNFSELTKHINDTFGVG